MPGALTKPFSDYSADEFYTLAHGLTYTGGHERERRCKNAPGCDGASPKKQTRVFVDAIATQDSLGASNVPQFGVLYMHAANRGDAEEAMYSLLPGNQYEYYLVVTGDSASGMRWHMEQLDVTAGARKLAEIGSGTFRGCNHPFVPGARADFKSCSAPSASAHDSLVHLGLALQGGSGDPLWVACMVGCCIGDPDK